MRLLGLPRHRFPRRAGLRLLRHARRRLQGGLGLGLGLGLRNPNPNPNQPYPYPNPNQEGGGVGAFYGGGCLIGVTFAALIAEIVWVGGTSFLMFFGLKMAGLLRVSSEVRVRDRQGLG